MPSHGTLYVEYLARRRLLPAYELPAPLSLVDILNKAAAASVTLIEWRTLLRQRASERA